MKKQQYKNIFFKTTQELNDQINELIEAGAIIESITPIHYQYFYNLKSDESKIDKTCCQEVFVVLHLK